MSLGVNYPIPSRQELPRKRNATLIVVDSMLSCKGVRNCRYCLVISVALWDHASLVCLMFDLPCHDVYLDLDADFRLDICVGSRAHCWFSFRNTECRGRI